MRAELGIPEGVKMLVFMYGGQPPGDWELRADSLPEGWVCVVCSNGQPPGNKQLPHNFLLAHADAYTPDLVTSLIPFICVVMMILLGAMQVAVTLHM